MPLEQDPLFSEWFMYTVLKQLADNLKPEVEEFAHDPWAETRPACMRRYPCLGHHSAPCIVNTGLTW